MGFFSYRNIRLIQQKYASPPGNVPVGNYDMDNSPKLQASKTMPSRINQRRRESLSRIYST